jgi:hypothetical protein
LICFNSTYPRYFDLFFKVRIFFTFFFNFLRFLIYNNLFFLCILPIITDITLLVLKLIFRIMFFLVMCIELTHSTIIFILYARLFRVFPFIFKKFIFLLFIQHLICLKLISNFILYLEFLEAFEGNHKSF